MSHNRNDFVASSHDVRFLINRLNRNVRSHRVLWQMFHFEVKHVPGCIKYWSSLSQDFNCTNYFDYKDHFQFIDPACEKFNVSGRRQAIKRHNKEILIIEHDAGTSCVAFNHLLEYNLKNQSKSKVVNYQQLMNAAPDNSSIRKRLPIIDMIS